MGIKESNLPIAESLGSGDKLRIVTSEGESKQIGADVVGGGVILVRFTVKQTSPDGSKIYQGDMAFSDAKALVYQGKEVVAIIEKSVQEDPGYQMNIFRLLSIDYTRAKFLGSDVNSTTGVLKCLEWSSNDIASITAASLS